ncbi:MAG TPA: ABC-type transport auxiliary lipoprotein family protein [Geminicoccaceae bacterium]|nr:ABC-type transport auxiliary lipoprotein family protein [Geminicoccaceae bacterium]
MTRWLGRVLALATCLAVGACAAALELARPDPPRLYALTPKSTFDDLPEVDARISVEVPTATAGLNTAQIALRPSPTTLEYYAGARWIDVVPVMVQNLLLESLDNAGRLDVLGREVVGIRADYALLTHIREFQAEYAGEGPPAVDVRIQARLVRLPRRTSVAATSLGFTVKAENRSMQAIVAAFDDGLGKALKGTVEWTVREVAKAQAASPVSGG